MAEDKVTFSMREVVAGKILAQLETANPNEKKRLLMQLLEQVDPTFVLALDFAYSMVPKPETPEK